MENFVFSDIEFEDDKLYWLVERLRDNFNQTQRNFASLCEAIYNIWNYCKNNYWKAKDNEYYNSYKLLAKFGFNKQAVSKYKQCYEKFVNNNSSIIESQYLNFSPSKLFELLPLSKETIDIAIKHKRITPDMTQKQLREYVKILKNGSSEKSEKVIENISNDINEDEIPMAYNPNEKYEYSYFEKMNKNQLLNIVWELQKAYQKLKNKGEKKNVK